MTITRNRLIAVLAASALLFVLTGCSDDDVAKARIFCKDHMDDCRQALAELQKIVGDQSQGAPPAGGGGGSTTPPAPPTGPAETQTPQASLGVIRWTTSRKLHVEGRAPEGVASIRLMVVSGSRVLTQADVAVTSGRFSVDLSLPETSGKGLAILAVNNGTNKGLGRFEVPNRP